MMSDSLVGFVPERQLHAGGSKVRGNKGEEILHSTTPLEDKAVHGGLHLQVKELDLHPVHDCCSLLGPFPGVGCPQGFFDREHQKGPPMPSAQGNRQLSTTVLLSEISSSAVIEN